MFDKDKIKFYGDNIGGVTGPHCQVLDSHPLVGGYECVNCKNCYRVEKRLWDMSNPQTDEVWKNGQYDGFVYCASNNSYFIRKIKKHIFNMQKKKMHIKKLGNERN